MPTPVHLYRHYDAKGILLYVGISKNFSARFSAHKMHSAWAPRSVRITVEIFPDRIAANIAELKAIEKEKPLYNKGHLEKPALKNKCPQVLERPHREEQTIMISVRLPVSIVDKMNKSCTVKDLSRSRLIEYAVIKFLK